MSKRKTPYGGYSTYQRTYKKRRTNNGNQKRYRRYVPRTMGPFHATESKYFDSYKSSTSIVNAISSWAGTEIDPSTLNTLFAPTEGSDINNRIGRKVQVYKISIRGLIEPAPYPDGDDILSSPYYRLILFQDKQSNGVQAQGEEVMGPPGTAAQNLTINTFQNTANFGRFKVLKDLVLRPRIVTASTDGTNTMSQNFSTIPFKVTYKFKNPVVVKFNATNGGSIGDIVDNSFHLLLTDSNTSFLNTVAYQCRTYYKDI